MSKGVCPSGYVELPDDKMRCKPSSGYAVTVLKTCPPGFTIGVTGFCLANTLATVEATCPSGYFSIPTDSSNCMTSTSSRIVTKECPVGYTLQTNGLCGTGNTYATTGPTYCGPQYNGKNCKYMSQVTSGITSATGTESGPNMICAFREGDAQFPCDPGCCKETTTTETTTTETTTTETTTTETTTTETTTEGFPLWAIILLIVLGTIILSGLVAWSAKKMSQSTRYGNIAKG